MSEKPCETFYFEHIASNEATPERYREFFSMLWAEHGETMFKHARSRLSNTEDARDICQDAFVRVMKYIQDNPDRIPLKVNFRAWLRVIVRNLVNDRFRKVMIRPRHVAGDALDMVPVDEPPEKRMIGAEAIEVLRECLSALTDNARHLVQMCDLDGVSESDAADLLNRKTNAIYVALHRARKALRECVGAKASLMEA